MKHNRSSRKVERTALRTSGLLDYLSRKGLTAQIGHPPAAWPLVLVKELIDNSLDACEEAGVAPEIHVTVDADGIEVRDNGPGIPPDVVRDSLDFSIRVSSREAYVAPDRGAQGNALKTIVAMPCVLDGKTGRIEISARGLRHDISIKVDRIRQEPIIDYHDSPDGLVRNGTSVRVAWPNSACSQEAEESRSLQDQELELADLEETGEIGESEGNSASSILWAAKSRFLQLADDFTFLNPHMTLTLDWHGEKHVVRAIDSEWRKWVPEDPTSALWYSREKLERLVAGLIAEDARKGADRTVREFLLKFRGLGSTAKQKRILEATGLNRAKLSSLVNGDGLDAPLIEHLLAAMQAHSTPVRPTTLGVIGKANLQAKFQTLGCEMHSFEYRKASGMTNGVPWVLEAAFAWCEQLEQRRLITGVNWSPGILNPFRELGRFGESLDALLEKQRASMKEPIVVLLQMAYPTVEYTDRGKSAVAID